MISFAVVNAIISPLPHLFSFLPHHPSSRLYRRVILKALNNRPSALFLYEVASHVFKTAISAIYYYYYYYLLLLLLYRSTPRTCSAVKPSASSGSPSPSRPWGWGGGRPSARTPYSTSPTPPPPLYTPSRCDHRCPATPPGGATANTTVSAECTRQDYIRNEIFFIQIYFKYLFKFIYFF